MPDGQSNTIPRWHIGDVASTIAFHFTR